MSHKNLQGRDLRGLEDTAQTLHGGLPPVHQIATTELAWYGFRCTGTFLETSTKFTSAVEFGRFRQRPACGMAQPFSVAPSICCFSAYACGIGGASFGSSPIGLTAFRRNWPKPSSDSPCVQRPVGMSTPSTPVKK